MTLYGRKCSSRGKQGNLSLLNSHKLKVMAHQHPLAFYINYIEQKPLTRLKAEFFKDAYVSVSDETYNLKEEWRIEFEAAPGGLEGIPYKLYFKDYLACMFDNARSEAIQQLDLQLINELDVKKVQVRLGVYIAGMDVLIAKVAKDANSKKYPVIQKAYRLLQEHMQAQAQTVGLMLGKSKRVPLKKDNVAKLQWTDTCKTLTQLFYHLYGEDRNGGQPFIRSGKANMVKFISDNFVGKDGLPYEQASIEDGLKPRSIKRRAKSTDALDIDSILKSKPSKSARGTK